MFRHGPQFLFLMLLVGLVLLRESRSEPLAGWEETFTDFLAAHDPLGKTLAPVTLVEINDAALASKPWPWSPLEFSLFLQAAIPMKPRVLAIEDVLDWETASLSDEQRAKTAEYEKTLHDQLLRAPKALIGAELGLPADPQVPPPVHEVTLLRHLSGDLSRIPEFPAVTRAPGELLRLAGSQAFTNLPEASGHATRVPLLFRYHGAVTPSFALQAVMLWAQLTPDEVSGELGRELVLGKLRVPIDATGALRLDFRATYTRVSFEDLLFAAEELEAGTALVVSLDPLRESVTLLARTDAATRSRELPGQKAVSSGELWAQAIATMQKGTFIRRLPLAWEIAIWLLLAGPTFFVPAWKKWWVVLGSAVVLAAYVGLALLIFSRWQISLPIVLPAGLVLSALILRVIMIDRPERFRRPVIL